MGERGVRAVGCHRLLGRACDGLRLRRLAAGDKPPRANRVLVYQYLITLTGVTSGIVFFGEELGVDKLVGGATILVGVYLARRQ